MRAELIREGADTKTSFKWKEKIVPLAGRVLLSVNVKERIMPIYEYRCEKCGQVNEFLILGRQQPLLCKECGSKDLTKLLSAHNTVIALSHGRTEPGSGGCCGTPNSCGTPGSCCSG